MSASMWVVDAIAEWLQTGHFLADPGDRPALGDVIDFQDPPVPEDLGDELARLLAEAAAFEVRYARYPGSAES